MEPLLLPLYRLSAANGKKLYLAGGDKPESPDGSFGVTELGLVEVRPPEATVPVAEE